MFVPRVHRNSLEEENFQAVGSRAKQRWTDSRTVTSLSCACACKIFGESKERPPLSPTAAQLATSSVPLTTAFPLQSQLPISSANLCSLPCNKTLKPSIVCIGRAFGSRFEADHQNVAVFPVVFLLFCKVFLCFVECRVFDLQGHHTIVCNNTA